MGNREDARVGEWCGGGETYKEEEGAAALGVAREGSRHLGGHGEEEKMREKSGRDYS
jgi:hypothetical protein